MCALSPLKEWAPYRIPRVNTDCLKSKLIWAAWIHDLVLSTTIRLGEKSQAEKQAQTHRLASVANIWLNHFIKYLNKFLLFCSSPETSYISYVSWWFLKLSIFQMKPNILWCLKHLSLKYFAPSHHDYASAVSVSEIWGSWQTNLGRLPPLQTTQVHSESLCSPNFFMLSDPFR